MRAKEPSVTGEAPSAGELSRLLAQSVQSGTAEDRFAWFNALGDACPLWARQQPAYPPWGRRTSEELDYTTLWRAMSACLEADEPTERSSTEVGRSRLALEWIKRLRDAAEMEDLETLRLQSFEQWRADDQELTPIKAEADLRRRLGLSMTSIGRAGRAGTGKLPPVPRTAIRALAREARVWLPAVRWGRARLIDWSGQKHWRISLAFLHSAEVGWLLSSGLPRADNVVSCHLLLHRFSTPGFVAHINTPAWVARYGYGNKFADRNVDQFPPTWRAYKSPIRSAGEP